MRYQAVRWLHDLDDEPVVLYSEVDEDGWEVRKVEEYRSGRLDVADADVRTGSTVLSETPMPLLEEIGAQPEFEGKLMTEEEFNEVWRRASERLDRPPDHERNA